MKKKREKSSSFLDELERAKERLGTVVDERWWVEEYHPEHTEPGYYGNSVPEQHISRSPYFDTKEEAEKYMDEHVPSQTFYAMRIRHQTCYERVERRWI